MKESFLNGTEIPSIDDILRERNYLKNFPLYEEIPKEFKEHNSPNKWNKLFSDWFFVGLKSLDITPKKGVDKDRAMKYIREFMGTWATKHEHKEAGIAYVMSLWFEDAKWEVKDK